MESAPEDAVQMDGNATNQALTDSLDIFIGRQNACWYQFVFLTAKPVH